mmetsp:Transcript_42080/g.85924  ORF Transcript_42080/g.85924 Transcript_42080/m.85924 type:complete len:214 (+) Transcript_42080:1636-2277(+)
MMIPFVIDLDTYGPIVRAPITSKTAPHMTAWPRVKALHPTAVPTELQMSFAAFPHAVRNEAMSPVANATWIAVACMETSVIIAMTATRKNKEKILAFWDFDPLALLSNITMSSSLSMVPAITMSKVATRESWAGGLSQWCLSHFLIIFRKPSRFNSIALKRASECSLDICSVLSVNKRGPQGTEQYRLPSSNRSIAAFTFWSSKFQASKKSEP